MDPVELTYALGLAVLLIAIAVFFALRQRQTLAILRHDTEMATDDRRFLHRQVVRRLMSSALLFLLGPLLLGGFLLEANLKELHPPEPLAEMPESAKESFRLLTGYWIATLLVFLTIMVLAVFDLVATARYGARKRRQLVEDRRAALEADVDRLQRDRHRLNGGL